MTMYYCNHCGFDSNNQPVVSLVFTANVVAKDSSLNSQANWMGGFAHKPQEVSDEEWSNYIEEKQQEWHTHRQKILDDNMYHFCGTDCLIEFLQKGEIK